MSGQWLNNKTDYTQCFPALYSSSNSSHFNNTDDQSPDQPQQPTVLFSNEVKLTRYAT